MAIGDNSYVSSDNNDAAKHPLSGGNREKYDVVELQ